MKSNGNRYITDTDGLNVTFQRDLDKLYLQYANLRHAIYQQHAWRFDNHVKKEELREYIDEQFILLTKEYNVGSSVDFPGYIKTKLSLRVKESYVKNRVKKEHNEFLGSNDDSIEMLAEATDDSLEDAELFSYVIEEGEFTDLQKLLLSYLVSNKYKLEHPRIISIISKSENINRKEVVEAYNSLYTYIKDRCKEFKALSPSLGINEKGHVNTKVDNL